MYDIVLHWIVAGDVSHEDGYFLWYSYVHWNDEHLRDWEGEHPGYDKCPRDLYDLYGDHTRDGYHPLNSDTLLRVSILGMVYEQSTYNSSFL